MATRRQPLGDFNQDNRDLLIELKTQMGSVGDALAALRAEVKEIKDGMKADIEFLKTDKISRAEAVRIQTDQQTVNADIEVRTRFLEKWGWTALGALTIISFLLNYFHPFIPK